MLYDALHRPAPSLEVPRLRLRLHVPRLTEGRTIFCLASIGYLIAASVLVFGYNSINNDALARVANAYYTIYSRDPHLAAVGFVWNPLPSLLMIPFLPLKALWPALIEQGFLANIFSALFMGGAVAVVRRTLADMGIALLPRLVLTLLFAVHPMIVYAGANGMTEAAFIFFTVLAAWRLLLWVETNDTRLLISAGIALAFGYLVRYESAVSAVGAAAVVLLMSYRRAKGDGRTRRLTALADAAIVGAPFLLVFLGWAVASWLIVGQPFEQFSSVYGNASQLAQGLGGMSLPTGEALDRSIRQILLFQPLLPAVVVVAMVAAVWRRDARLLAIVAVVGSTLAFQVVAFVDGQTAGWLRYYISAIPLATLLAASVVAGRSGCAANAMRPQRPALHRLAPVCAGLIAVAMVAPSVASATALTTNRELASEEVRHLGVIFHPERSDQAQQRLSRRFATEREVAAYLDGLHLPEGSVLVDVYSAFPIVLISNRPRQFVVNSDYDFEAVLVHPSRFGIKYLITQPAAGGQLNAIGRQYPGVYETGAGIATLDRHFDNRGDLPNWRIYEMNEGA